jgi:hypothetical protein
MPFILKRQSRKEGVGAGFRKLCLQARDLGLDRRLILNEVDVLDGRLDLLGHELLDALHEDDGDEGDDDEGDDGGPCESIGGGVGVVAGVECSGENAGADAWDGGKSGRVTHCHALHEVSDGGFWETGLDGCGSDLGSQGLADLVVDYHVDDC